MASPRDKRVPVPLCLVPSAAPADAPAGVCILEASNSLCAEPRDSGHLHSVFYLSAMLPTFASDFAQSLGPTAGGEDPAITIFAGERMDGHDSSRWVRRITTILKARTIPVKVQDTSLFPIVRRSIMSINSALRLSATFIALVVCFDVVRFDPKTTTPPMTAAIAPIIAAASNQTAPSK